MQGVVIRRNFITMKRNLYFVLGLIAIVAVAASYQIRSNDKPSTGESLTTTVQVISIGKPTGTAAIFKADTSTSEITWNASGYPKNVGVNIHLLRKVSNSPSAYELVRQIVVNTPNDGKEMWTALPNESGDDLYIEVTCSTSFEFTQGCSVASLPLQVIL
jgi:hypothetical protein